MNESQIAAVPHVEREAATRERLLAVALNLVGATLLATFALHLYRVLYEPTACDFPKLHAAGRHVLENATRQPDSLLSRYLPSVDVAWAAIAALPIGLAATMFYLLNLAALLWLLRTIGRDLLIDSAPAERPLILVSATLAASVAVAAHFALGSFHLIMLALLIAGVLAALRGDHIRGGLLLGAAVWLKLLPAIAIPYLLLKRRLAAAIIALAVAIAIDAGLSVTAFGWNQSLQWHRDWLDTAQSKDAKLVFNTEIGGYAQSPRNQSLAAVLRRLLAPPSPSPTPEQDRNVALANLSTEQIRGAWLSIVAALLVALAWWARTPATSLAPRRRAAEVALLALLTMWLSPVCWTYYPVAALPALAVVLGSRWERSRLSIAAILAWLLASVAQGSIELRAAGIVFWASVLLAIALIAAANRSPSAAPHHPA